MGDRVVVTRLPDCDFCADLGIKRPAAYDGRTQFGPWANMCEEHFQLHGVGLGTGSGQRLILKSTLNDFVCLGEMPMRKRCSCLGDDQRDDTEGVRRLLTAAINQNPEGRAELVAAYGQVWDTDELRRDFEVLGFMAPFVVVRRRSDGVKGSLMFQHQPRFYFDWTPDKG